MNDINYKSLIGRQPNCKDKGLATILFLLIGAAAEYTKAIIISYLSFVSGVGRVLNIKRNTRINKFQSRNTISSLDVYQISANHSFFSQSYNMKKCFLFVSTYSCQPRNHLLDFEIIPKAWIILKINVPNPSINVTTASSSWRRRRRRHHLNCDQLC